MLSHWLRRHTATLFVSLLAVGLACGWGARERVHAEEKAKLLASKTVTAADVTLKDFVWEGKPTGQVGVYFDGATATTRNFVTGKFVLAPGLEPHPIHQHPEEEIMIVTAGAGEISCDGKTTPVGAGSIMFTAPNVKHGIKNTGKEPLTFYFVKWVSVGAAP
jgi:quercetin dioxygenase-like cupin family protein